MNPLTYFAFFRYVPTLREYRRFSQSKKLPAGYQIIKGRVVSKANRYLLAGTLKRQTISRNKIQQKIHLLKFLGGLSWIKYLGISGTVSMLNAQPKDDTWIKYLGISGTVSMLNAQPKDDIDLFVITKANKLWTARFWLIIITLVLGVRRKPKDKNYRNKLCLNLFFSEANLKIPKRKQTQYVAHEILQLKTIVNKDETYEELLLANLWVSELFPQAPMPNYPRVKRVEPFVGARGMEKLLRRWQLFLINRHRTQEIVTDTQLWFFPDDFEKKLPF